MRILFLFILTLGQVYAQEKLTKGYYIDRNKQTKECFFDESKLQLNPYRVKIKTTEDGEFKDFFPSDIYEFGIDKKFKFLSKNVEIDMSSNSISNMSWKKQPENVEKNVFLKVLVNGDFQLLKYEGYDVEKFYLMKDNNIKQLIYKKFLHKDKVKENLSYKSQLSELLTCGIQNNDVSITKYNENDLIEIVNKHNQCSNPNNTFTYTYKNESKIHLGLYVKGGLKSFSTRIKSNDFYNSRFYSTDFDNTSPNISTELEVVFPFNYNRFSIFLESSFFQFSNQNMDSDNTGRKLSLNFLQINVGSRYYFKEHTRGFFVYGALSFLNPLSGSYYEVDITGNSIVKYTPSASLPIKIGFGYLYKNKIYLDFSYLSNASIFSSSDNISNSTISSLGFQVGYKFL